MNKRPIGITILCILNFIGGIVGLVGILVMQVFFGNLIEQLSNLLGVSPVFIVILLVFLMFLSIISAIGMWLGKRWGWWIAASYYFYAVVRTGYHIFIVLGMSEQLVNSSRGVSYYLTMDIIKIILNSLILLYLFKNNVREYFKLTSLSKKKAILILVGIGVGIFVITFLTTRILSSNKLQKNDSGEEIEYSEENVVIDDAVIDQDDVYNIIEPLMWDVDIYSGETSYNQSLKNYSDEQKYVFAIWEYSLEVNNGGHTQFYYNSTGIVWEDAINGFQKIGLTEYYDIIKESISRFGKNPSKDRQKRQSQLDELTSPFNDLDDRFFQLEEDKSIEEALLKYIKDNRDKFYYNGIVRKPVDS